MRLTFICILVVSLFVIAQAQTLDNETRFWGSIGGWINNNIVKPIESTVINPIVDGTNQVINTIVSGTNTVASTLTGVFGDVVNLPNQVLDGINVAVNTVSQSFNQVVDMAASIFTPVSEPSVPGGASADLCGATCFQRIKVDNNVKDYYFNQANGCISKGYATHHTVIFNSCCDMHNTCLNAQW